MVQESVLRNNSAPSGAAIGEAEYWQGEYWLRNCLIYSNNGSFAVMDEGWRVNDLTLDIAYCTIVDNPNGGVNCAAYCDNQYTASKGMRIRDCIIAGNGPTGVSYAQSTFSPATNQYNDVHGHSVTNYAGDASAGAGSISADHRFTARAQQDYHLTPSSPCKDAAVDVGIGVDLEGEVRPQDAGYAMGCYETVKPGGPQTGATVLVR